MGVMPPGLLSDKKYSLVTSRSVNSSVDVPSTLMLQRVVVVFDSHKPITFDVE